MEQSSTAIDLPVNVLVFQTCLELDVTNARKIIGKLRAEKVARLAIVIQLAQEVNSAIR